MTQFEQIAQVLQKGGVQFIVIGGWAGIFHGLAHSTFDETWCTLETVKTSFA